MSARPPNPGSDAAIKLGCKCPVLDNNRGKWAPWPPDGWWYSGDCTLHASKAEKPLLDGVEANWDHTRGEP